MNLIFIFTLLSVPVYGASANCRQATHNYRTASTKKAKTVNQSVLAISDIIRNLKEHGATIEYDSKKKNFVIKSATGKPLEPEVLVLVRELLNKWKLKYNQLEAARNQAELKYTNSYNQLKQNCLLIEI